jgi:probable DNA metabolism protein
MFSDLKKQLSLNYIYDGSFEGLLTCIYEAYYRKEKPARVLKNETIQQGLLDTNVYIPSDPEKAGKVYNSIIGKISPEAMQNAYYAYLSNDENTGTYVYNYIRLGFKLGGKVDLYLADDRVLKIHEISRRVSSERHLMLGLIRFRQIRGEIYYASYKPDNNITALLAPHFADRMSDQNWVIHDVKRNIAALYNKEKWVITDISSDSFNFSEEEMDYQGLWKDYFKNIAIQDRINPRLQRQHMPKRYWEYLIEK